MKRAVGAIVTILGASGMAAAGQAASLPKPVKEQIIDRLHRTAVAFFEEDGNAVKNLDLSVNIARQRMSLDPFLPRQGNAKQPYLSSDSIIDRLKELAAKNDDALDYISLIEEQIPRGSLSDSFEVLQYELAGKAMESLPMKFHAEETAIIYAEGPIGAELDMVVLDSGDKPVCEDNRPGPYMLCRWTPTRGEEVKVNIINRSAEASRFFLLTN